MSQCGMCRVCACVFTKSCLHVVLHLTQFYFNLNTDLKETAGIILQLWYANFTMTIRICYWVSHREEQRKRHDLPRKCKSDQSQYNENQSNSKVVLDFYHRFSFFHHFQKSEINLPVSERMVLAASIRT